jgi:hypothetical protein
VRASPRREGGGVKGRCAAAEAHKASPAGGAAGGSAGASADGHAREERAPRGVSLGRRAGVMMLPATGARPTGRQRGADADSAWWRKAPARGSAPSNVDARF